MSTGPLRLIVRSPLRIAFIFFCFSTVWAFNVSAHQMRVDPEVGPGRAAGSSGNLPIGTGQTKAEVIAHAQTMPRVIQALDECLDRGYMRLPEVDQACFFYNPGGTVVFLAFEKPDINLPEGTAGGPVVIIGSMMNEANDVQTRISGGLLFVDQNTGALTTGNDYPQFNFTDSDFNGEDLTKGGGGRKYITPDFWAALFIPRRIKKYAACAGFGNAVCLVNLLPLPTQWGGIKAGICVLLTTGRCFYTNFMED